MVNMKINLKIIIILAVVLIFIATIITIAFLKKDNVSTNVPNENLRETVIEQYLLAEEKDGYFRSADSKFFCAVEVLWEYDLTKIEKVVYAPNNCASVVLMNGDLRGESGGGRSPLFKMEYKNNKWVVIDTDNRGFGDKSPITQDWVKDAEKMIPKNIKNRCFANNCFSTDGVIKKAAEYFKVNLPEYPFNSCNTNNDCASDSICVLNGDHSNQGPNTCVKKCNTNSDCGIAHTCRYQCINGENGCPDTAEKICIPDLLSPDVEKDPNSFVGFDDFEIHRRRAIEQAYSEFSEDFEKQPCFAGCSVKIVEDSKSYYYAFITHGSGVPIVKASCFRVEGGPTTTFKVSKIGEFSDMTDSSIGYKDFDPKTCGGIN
jgi:hypothetical protein